MQCTSVGSMCCHSIQACIDRFRQCQTMWQIRRRLCQSRRGPTHFWINSQSHMFLLCRTRRRPSACLCAVAAMVTHHDTHGTLAAGGVSTQPLKKAWLRQRAKDLWRSARKRVRWYLILRKKWSAIGSYLKDMKPLIGPVPNSHVPKLKKKYPGRSTSSR